MKSPVKEAALNLPDPMIMKLEKALEAVLLKHDDRVDAAVSLFLKHKEDFDLYLSLVKDVSPERKAEFIEVMKSIGKAFK